jgi:hypothetical protein
MFRAIHIACELECSQDDGCNKDELNDLLHFLECLFVK